MKLSEKLRIDHDCGDFGTALEGYAEEAEKIERVVSDLLVHIDELGNHPNHYNGLTAFGSLPSRDREALIIKAMELV